MSTAIPNHRRTKPGGIKPGATNSGVTGPTSQIPGLCQSATDSAPAERSSGRRVGIFESDSDYVKLAKQGGHKGLLSHDGDSDDKPMKAYNPPNWFGDDESKSESKATSPNSQTKGERPPLAAPFGTDNSPTWEREPDSFSHNKDQELDDESIPQASPDGAADQMEGLSLGNKYKRRSYDKKTTTPVSMSKLLSHGYVENKKKSSNDDDTSSVTSEQTSTTMTEDVDDLE
uniref:Si:dkey-276j7.1 n=1 Tax=Oryzias latipes TaxID=8090 RepID=A0A3P9J0G6_ORYLA